MENIVPRVIEIGNLSDQGKKAGVGVHGLKSTSKCEKMEPSARSSVVPGEKAHS